MKLWMLTWNTQAETGVVGVFSTRQKAEEREGSQPAIRDGLEVGLFVQEITVDEEVDEVR